MVTEVLNAPGEALDRSVRTEMESRFGVDFSGVRIHRDACAAESAGAVHAHAYTSGSDLVFAEGRYTPDTDKGQRLTARELTHVVQQAAGPVAGTPTADGCLSISDPEDPFEQEAKARADEVAGSLAAGNWPEANGSSAKGVPVQRSWLDDLGDVVSDAASAVASGVGSVVDTGAILASDADSAIVSGASSVWDSASNVVSDAVEDEGGSSSAPADAALPGGVSAPPGPDNSTQEASAVSQMDANPCLDDCEGKFNECLNPPWWQFWKTPDPNQCLAERQACLRECQGASKGRWSCEASCNVEGTEPQCTGRVTGSSSGHSSEEEACREAKRDATQKAPRGCYARHCRCFNCTDR
jgi:hypothetical protein